MRTRDILVSLLIGVGLGLCAGAALFYLHGGWAQRQGRETFERLLRSTPTAVATAVAREEQENPNILSSAPTPTPAPSYPYGQPVARIRIPVAGIDCIVFGGTDEATLAKGPGHVPGTALPGAGGPPNNCVIAGHRDTQFRHLGWLKPGHTIELDTPSGDETYKIVRREIVDPDAVSVLAPTAQPQLTLITCYPFDYIGPAPKRLVLVAEPVGASSGHRS